MNDAVHPATNHSFVRRELSRQVGLAALRTLIDGFVECRRASGSLADGIVQVVGMLAATQRMAAAAPVRRRALELDLTARARYISMPGWIRCSR